MVNKKYKQGFTLIELSIVIVIIGLIVAGVVGGGALIEQSRVRAQIAQLESYKTAYNTFKLKYDAIAGDFANASGYWPGVANGDGNSRITEDCNGANDNSFENMKFFQHLSEANLIAGDFNNSWQIDAGYPELKIAPNSGMVACGMILSGHTDGEIQTHHQISIADARKQYRAVLALNVNNPGVANSSYNDNSGVQKPKTMQDIDNKIDDGVATLGKFIGYKAWESIAGGVGTCLDGVNGNYNLGNDLYACNAIYVLE